MSDSITSNEAENKADTPKTEKPPKLTSSIPNSLRKSSLLINHLFKGKIKRLACTILF